MFRSWRCKSVLDARLGWVVDTNYSGSVLKVHWDDGSSSWVNWLSLEDIDDDEFDVEVK